MICNVCPRRCGAERSEYEPGGVCASPALPRIARAAPHYGEEPCVSGERGSGAVFFSGCSLGCAFCQNRTISKGQSGKVITVEHLAELILDLQAQKANNINLVTAGHFLPQVRDALILAKEQGLTIPVVYNSSGYEKPETIRLLKDYVDIYLPDLKYFSSKLSQKYSKAEDYFKVASNAVRLMIEQTGKPVFDSDGILQKGVIIRHLVLPNCRKDSITLLHWIKETLPDKSYLISLLSQYTPFYKSHEYPELNRRITTYEYESVLKEAISLGLVEGFMQEKSSAKEEYTPPFNLEGL